MHTHVRTIAGQSSGEEAGVGSEALTGRVEFRVRPDAERTLRAAARRESVSLSAFITAAALERAATVLERDGAWIVDEEYLHDVLAWLDEPPVAHPQLVEAIRTSRAPRRS